MVVASVSVRLNFLGEDTAGGGGGVGVVLMVRWFSPYWWTISPQLSVAHFICESETSLR